MTDDAVKMCNETLLSGMLTQADRVDEFENAISTILHKPYIVTTNSCTSALTIALRLVLPPQTTTVLVPALSCFATIAPVLTTTTNVNIRFIDVMPNSCIMDVEDIARKLDETVSVIILVHLFGISVDIDSLDTLLGKIEEDKRPAVIHDCAQALTLDTHMVNTRHNISVYSTQAIKHLTTGDGGFLAVDNVDHYEQAKLLRWYGLKRRRDGIRHDSNVVDVGYKMHMNDINASIGLGNLPRVISHVVPTHIVNGRLLHAHVDTLTYVKNVVDHMFNSLFWVFPVIVNSQEVFIDYMRDEHKIAASQVHYRLDKHDATKKYASSLPNLNDVEHKYVCVPCGWWVDDIERVKHALTAFDQYCSEHQDL